MSEAIANGLHIAYERDGSPRDPAVLLIPGLGGQLVYWPDELVQALVEAGFQVVRMDNRDSGLSEGIDDVVRVGAVIAALLDGSAPAVPYVLGDMGDDCAGLLTALGIDRAHVVGVSMGGMIAQTVATRHPDRVRSLTSIMSTTGALDVGQPTLEAQALLYTAPPQDRAGAIEASVAACRLLWGRHFDDDRARRSATVAYDRAFRPDGVGRQLAALLASGDRTHEIKGITAPTLVIHGDQDPLVDVSGGVATAGCIPGAALMVLEGVGHDVPPVFHRLVLDRLVEHFRAAP